MSILILLVQIFLFSGFIFSASKYFKKESGTVRPQQLAIQILGIVQILNSLYFSLHFSVENRAVQAISLFFFFISIVYFYWAFSTVRKQVQLNFAFSKSSPQSIIQDGPYGHLRHPFYFSYICAWIGAVFITQFSVISIVAGITLSILYVLAAKQEEHEFSQNNLKNLYDTYKQKTYRIVPFLY